MLLDSALQLPLKSQCEEKVKERALLVRTEENTEWIARSEVSEQVNEWAQRSARAKRAEQANKWAVQENKWTDKWVAQYLNLGFWLMWPSVEG